MARRRPPRQTVTLGLRTVYILPSRHGLLYLFAAALVFVAAINYAISLAFGLAFFMVSLFLVTVIHTVNTLNRLTLTALPTQPVFCGEDAAFQVQVSRGTRGGQEGLTLSFAGGPESHLDLVDTDRAAVAVFCRTTRRGRLQAPLLRLSTVYPLGLARAWAVVNLDQTCLVYPRPVPMALDLADHASAGSQATPVVRTGTEDFHGLRSYVPGDPMNQVSWKHVARGQGMQVKQFVEPVGERVWLDWDRLPGFNPEERLSRLCYGVLTLSRSGVRFGLRLPGLTVAPATGAAHRAALLEHLALFRAPSGASHGH